MRICFIADWRSVHSRSWVSNAIACGHRVTVISTFPAQQNQCVEGPTVVERQLPLASWATGAATHLERSPGWLGSRLRRAIIRRAKFFFPLDAAWYGWVAPAGAYLRVQSIREVLDRDPPDLVHALRTQPEGELAALVGFHPLIVSSWGSDFTFWARRYPLHRRLTRATLRTVDGLITDCRRDLLLATSLGFDATHPSTVLPSGGGIDRAIFHEGPASEALRKSWNISPGTRIVANPRRWNPAAIRNEVFFRAVRILATLMRRQNLVVLCVGMANNPVVERWARRLDITHKLRLLPQIGRQEMADLLRLAEVVVSPGEHDGTPNVLLEAMACGAFPVAGDIESTREWVEHGVNGLLVDPSSPESLAQAMALALSDDSLREKARVINRGIVDRVDRALVTRLADRFYHHVVNMSRAGSGRVGSGEEA